MTKHTHTHTWQHMNVPLRLTLKVWSHSSKLVSSLAEFMLMPALLQAMWIAPHLETTLSVILWTSSGLLMSAVIDMALMPVKKDARVCYNAFAHVGTLRMVAATSILEHLEVWDVKSDSRCATFLNIKNGGYWILLGFFKIFFFIFAEFNSLIRNEREHPSYRGAEEHV